MYVAVILQNFILFYILFSLILYRIKNRIIVKSYMITRMFTVSMFYVI